MAVKLSTGEPPASNYLRPELIKDVVQAVDGTIVECNTAYGGSRAQTAMHYQVAKDHGFGVLMAATIGVPLYACGGGTIPLLMQWLADGMSLGSASAFMITGPATKITNLGALKIVLGVRNFVLYLTFVVLFSLVTGILVDLL